MKPLMQALLLVSMLWAVCFVACLGLAGIADASKPDNVTEGGITHFGEALFLVFTTFHGNTWGHTIPITAGQRFASSVAALLGYLFTPAAFAMCLKAAGAQKQLMGSIVSFLVAYFACMSIAVLIHAIVYNSDSKGKNGFEMSLYYAWMTFHNRCYGELYPVGAAHEFFAALSSVLSLMPALTAGLTALAFTSTVASAMAHPTPKSLAKAVGKVQVCVGDAEVSLDCAVDHEKVMTMLGIPDLDVAPPGMVTVSLKDRVSGDSAEGMVAALYEALPNGAQHQKRMQVPTQADGWLVYVPSEDVAQLQEVWQSQMQNARKNIEERFKAEGKKRRAPRLRFHIPESSSSSTQSSAGPSHELYSQSSCSIGMASDPTSATESSSSTFDKDNSYTASI